jgi:hypothetical protein
MPRPISARPAVSFIAWSSVPGRSMEIAKALGGEANCFYDFRFVDRRAIPLRYAASAIRTVLHLLFRRPRAVIASNPPIFPGLIAYLYGLVTGAPVVLDSHPGGFGLLEDKKFIKLMMPLHRFLIPRVRGSVVTVDELVDLVQQQGGRAAIVHEAPPLWTTPPPPPLPERPVVLFVCVFDDDEPVSLVAEAAHRLPGVDILITGDMRKCPPELLERPAPNLRFVGFLDQSAYRDALAEANIVMTLTELPEAVNRVANEAVFARRPLIVSDWPVLSRYFPYAVRVANSIDGVVAGIEKAIREYDELRAHVHVALKLQKDRWEEQLNDLRQLVATS